MRNKDTADGRYWLVLMKKIQICSVDGRYYV